MTDVYVAGTHDNLGAQLYPGTTAPVLSKAELTDLLLSIILAATPAEMTLIQTALGDLSTAMSTPVSTYITAMFDTNNFKNHIISIT